MAIYYSSFISGFETLIITLLRQDLPDLQQLQLLDGAIVYQSQAPVEQLINLRYFNNTFLVLQHWPTNLPPTVHTLQTMLQRVLQQPWSAPKVPSGGFKLVCSLANRLTAVDKHLMAKTIDCIERRTHARYHSRAHSEFWCIYRSESVGFWLWRLTALKRRPQPGELRPELAHLLCKLSHPQPQEIFLDPCCGTGTIPLERARIGKFKAIFALDHNPELIAQLKQKMQRLKQAAIHRSMFPKVTDCLSYPFEDEFIDTIVTDPPWGLYQPLEPDFYPRLLQTCRRILKPEGQLILLTAYREYWQNPEHYAGFLLEQQLHILVSGKSATVYCLHKS